MRHPLLSAVQAQLETTGLPAYFVNAPETPESWPYLLWWTTSGRYEHLTLSDEQETLADVLGVTAVATTPEGAVLAAGAARSALHRATLRPDGLVVWLRHSGAEPVTVDTTHKIDGSGRHPAFAPATYRLNAAPA